MALKSRVVIALLALIAFGACKQEAPTNQSAAPTPPSGPAAAVATNSYQGVGVVKGLNPKRPGIEIDHQEIVGLMPAMQMEFPVTDPALLNGLAVNDQIDFTIEDNQGEMRVTAIKKK